MSIPLRRCFVLVLEASIFFSASGDEHPSAQDGLDMMRREGRDAALHSGESQATAVEKLRHDADLAAMSMESEERARMEKLRNGQRLPDDPTDPMPQGSGNDSDSLAEPQDATPQDGADTDLPPDSSIDLPSDPVSASAGQSADEDDEDGDEADMDMPKNVPLLTGAGMQHSRDGSGLPSAALAETKSMLQLSNSGMSQAASSGARTQMSLPSDPDGVTAPRDDEEAALHNGQDPTAAVDSLRREADLATRILKNQEASRLQKLPDDQPETSGATAPLSNEEDTESASRPSEPPTPDWNHEDPLKIDLPTEAPMSLSGVYLPPDHIDKHKPEEKQKPEEKLHPPFPVSPAQTEKDDQDTMPKRKRQTGADLSDLSDGSMDDLVQGSKDEDSEEEGDEDDYEGSLMDRGPSASTLQLSSVASSSDRPPGGADPIPASASPNDQDDVETVPPDADDDPVNAGSADGLDLIFDGDMAHPQSALSEDQNSSWQPSPQYIRTHPAKIHSATQNTATQSVSAKGQVVMQSVRPHQPPSAGAGPGATNARHGPGTVKVKLGNAKQRAELKSLLSSLRKDKADLKAKQKQQKVDAAKEVEAFKAAEKERLEVDTLEDHFIKAKEAVVLDVEKNLTRQTNALMDDQQVLAERVHKEHRLWQHQQGRESKAKHDTSQPPNPMFQRRQAASPPVQPQENEEQRQLQCQSICQSLFRLQKEKEETDKTKRQDDEQSRQEGRSTSNSAQKSQELRDIENRRDSYQCACDTQAPSSDNADTNNEEGAESKGRAPTRQEMGLAWEYQPHAEGEQPPATPYNPKAFKFDTKELRNLPLRNLSGWNTQTDPTRGTAYDLYTQVGEFPPTGTPTPEPINMTLPAPGEHTVPFEPSSDASGNTFYGAGKTLPGNPNLIPPEDSLHQQVSPMQAYAQAQPPTQPPQEVATNQGQFIVQGLPPGWSLQPPLASPSNYYAGPYAAQMSPLQDPRLAQTRAILRAEAPPASQATAVASPTGPHVPSAAAPQLQAPWAPPQVRAPQLMSSQVPPQRTSPAQVAPSQQPSGGFQIRPPWWSMRGEHQHPSQDPTLESERERRMDGSSM